MAHRARTHAHRGRTGCWPDEHRGRGVTLREVGMKYVLRYAMASDLDLARVGALFPERERWGPFRVEGTLLAIGSSRSRIQSPGSLTLMSARPFVGGRIVKKPP